MSAHARGLARTKNAALLVQDEFLDALYPGEIRSIQDFVRYSARFRSAFSLHIRDLLSRGVSVVLDCPGNTRAPDDLCKRQLWQRSEALPTGSAWNTFRQEPYAGRGIRYWLKQPGNRWW